MKTLPLFSYAFAALLALAPLASADEASAINAIRKQYSKIVDGKPIKTTEIDFSLEDDPMEGTITRFVYADGLLAVKVSYSAGDHGASDEHFYYNDKGLFFIFVKDHYWRFGPGGTEEKPASIETLTERRYYLQNGSCLRALERAAQSDNVKKLPALIAKKENKPIKLDEQFQDLLKSAKAMRTIKTTKEAEAFFGR